MIFLSVSGLYSDDLLALDPNDTRPDSSQSERLAAWGYLPDGQSQPGPDVAVSLPEILYSSPPLPDHYETLLLQAKTRQDYVSVMHRGQLAAATWEILNDIHSSDSPATDIFATGCALRDDVIQTLPHHIKIGRLNEELAAIINQGHHVDRYAWLLIQPLIMAFFRMAPVTEVIQLPKEPMVRMKWVWKHYAHRFLNVMRATMFFNDRGVQQVLVAVQNICTRDHSQRLVGSDKKHKHGKLNSFGQG